jgi:hypothetical protein
MDQRFLVITLAITTAAAVAAAYNAAQTKRSGAIMTAAFAGLAVPMIIAFIVMMQRSGKF